MAKTKISEFSANPANNTDIDNINIAEGCAPSGINDAIRELMAQLKDFQVGSAGDPVTVGGVFTVTAGAVGTPAITTAGDTNTGIFFPAADQVAITTGGTQRAVVDASGNVGIGTSSPSYKLDVQGTGDVWARVQNNTSGSGSARLLLQNNGDSGFGIINNSGASGVVNLLNYKAAPMAFWTDSTERMRIDSSGNVGIGTSSPGVKLEASSVADIFRLRTSTARGSGNGFMSFYDPTGRKAYLGYGASDDNFYIANEMNASMLFLTNGSERARIDSGGRFLVGLTTAYSDGSIGAPVLQWVAKSGNYVGAICSADATSNLGAIAFKNPNGVVGQISTSGSATSYATSSDYRLKENVQPMQNALARVAALKPCTYKWKVDGSDGQGFIAHELAEVEPGCVTGEKDAVDAEGNPKYQGIDTSFLVATLTAAIQEQQAIIEQLKADVDALKAAQPE